MATTTARGLLRLRLPLLPRLIPTTDTTDLATTMARGLLMLLLLPRPTLTTGSTASVPTTATLATPMSRMLLSTARGLLKLPLRPSLLLIPTTATAMLDTTATLATPTPTADTVTTTAKGLLMLLPTPTMATTA